MSFCNQCGASLMAGAHFCPSCGANVDRDHSRPEAAATTGGTPEKVIQTASKVRSYWIIAGAGCAGMLSLALIVFGLLYWLGSRNQASPPPQVSTEILFREVSHPDDKLFYEIPADWEETGAKGLYQAAPPATHSDAGQVWVRVQSVPRGKQKAQDAVAKALGKWLEALPGLEVDRTYPMLTRPGGEVVRDESSIRKDEILIFSTVVDLHFTEPASGKRWRGLISASHQADGRSSHAYLTGIASVEERWEDFSPVFLRLLAGTKVVLKPK